MSIAPRAVGRKMAAKWRVFFVVSVLAFGWYFFVGLFDQLLMNHTDIGASNVCLSRYLPPNTIHNPEGWPSMPLGSYRVVPLGIDCTFTMEDGSAVRSFHPRYYTTAWAALPLAPVLFCGAWMLASDLHRRSEM